MPSFGKTSRKRLETCAPAIQKILNEAIKIIDFSVMEGHRSTEKQFEYYQKGRELIDGKWVVTEPGEKITNIDGINKKSQHNYAPSMAVDLAPYPTGYTSLKEFYRLAGVIETIADRLEIKIKWGGDWSWKDHPHFEI
jgi:hypothetical protein